MTRHSLRGRECSWGLLAAALRWHGVKKGQWYHSNCEGVARNTFTAQTRVPKTAPLTAWWGWEAGRTACQPLTPPVFILPWLEDGLWLCPCQPSPRVYSTAPRCHQHPSALSNVFPPPPLPCSTLPPKLNKRKHYSSYPNVSRLPPP